MNIRNRDLYMIKRKRKGITLQILAQFVGISAASLSQYERGLINLKKENLALYHQFIDEFELNQNEGVN